MQRIFLTIGYCHCSPVHDLRIESLCKSCITSYNILTYLCAIYPVCVSGFQLSFQMVKNKSQLTTSSYAEYTGDLKTTTTFTACFWFNIQYFSFSSNYLWQFCFVKNQEDLPSCTAFGIQNTEKGLMDIATACS